MPTALELLETEICDDILVVDLESRSIIIPKNVSVLGVEADDETRILHFKVPRRYCEVDLAEFAIRVNYKNAKSEGDMYIVTDAVIEDDWITFDWVVGRHAFTKKGNVVFNVCLKDVFEGIVRREFNTTVAILPVLEGLETGEEIAEEHLDIFEQMREELTANIGDDIGEAIDTYVAEHADELRGEPFKYEDFTAEQLEALRGPKGDTFTYDDLTEEQIQSLKGPKGDTFTYDDLTEEQIQSLKGPKGDTFTYDDLTEEQIQSLKGPQGDPFEYEDFTEEQLAKLAGPAGSSIKSIARTSGNGAPGTTDTYTVTLTDGSTTTFKVYNGANGEGAGDMTSTVYDPQNKKQDIFKYVDDAVANVDLPDDIGDMQATVYDPQGKAQDIFKYVDDASGIPNLGENITEGSTNDTVAFWAEKGSGQAWFSATGMLVNQPDQYGFVISYVHGTDVFQMFSDQTNGVTYFRYGDNVNNWFKHWAALELPGMATDTELGLVMVNGNNGIGVNTEDGNLFIKQASNSEIDGKEHSYKPITPENLDYAVKAALANNAHDLSDSERTSALAWLGAAAEDHTHDNLGGGIATITAASTDGVAYTAELDGLTAYTDGLMVAVVTSVDSTGNSTLNINNLGAVPVGSLGLGVHTSGSWVFNEDVLTLRGSLLPAVLMYRGGYWVHMGFTRVSINGITGTFGGVVKAQSQAPGTSLLRNSKLLDATTYDAVTNWSQHLNNGEIAWRYE